MSTSKFVVPQEALDVLKCATCQKYLSIPPIFFETSYGESYRCGRCTFSNKTSPRAILYEKFAQYMIFPCINERCKEKLPWGSVKDHENTCPFRSIICPSDDCDLSVEIHQIVPHFNIFHTDYKKMNYLEVSDASLVAENFTVFLLVQLNKSKPFLFFQYTNAVYIWFSVYSFDQTDCDKNFEVRLLSKKNSFTLSEQKVVLFNNKEHCINCIMRMCQSKIHKYSKTNAPYTYSREISDAVMTTRLDNQTVKNILQTDVIDFTVRIIDESSQSPKAKKKKIETRASKKEGIKKEREEMRQHIDKILMDNIECPVCSSYMSAPIYQCKTGHSLCKSCLHKLKKCPLCQAELLISRNFALEKISEIFKIVRPNQPKQKM